MVDVGAMRTREGFEERYMDVQFACDDQGLTNGEMLEVLDLIATSSLRQSQKGKLVGLLVPGEMVGVDVVMRVVGCLGYVKLGDSVRRKLASWLANSVVCMDYGQRLDRLIPWVWNLLKVGSIRGSIVQLLVYWIGYHEDLKERVFCQYRLDMIVALSRVDPRIGPLVWALRHLIGEVRVRKTVRGVDEGVLAIHEQHLGNNEKFMHNLRVYRAMDGSGKLTSLNQYVRTLASSDSNINVLKYISSLKLDVRVRDSGWDACMVDVLDLVLVVDQVELDYVFNVLLGHENDEVALRGFMTEILAKLRVCCQVGHRLPGVVVSVVEGDVRVLRDGVAIALDIRTLREMAADRWLEYLPGGANITQVAHIARTTRDGDMVCALARLATRWAVTHRAAASELLDLIGIPELSIFPEIKTAKTLIALGK